MLRKHFEALTDVRQRHKVKYDLLETVLMTICAVIAGLDSWRQIADFCRKKIGFFREKFGLKLSGGIPSHDTFRTIFGLIIPAEFEKCFTSWVRAAVNLTNGDVINIDGKTLRGSRKGDCPPLHLVSAWANKSRMVLGQIKTDGKSNEITAIPNLLKVLELKGCIITIDAMGCQKEIAEDIAEKNDYVLALKGNQSNIHKSVFTYFEETLQDERLYFNENRLKMSEKSHGRIEKRAYYLSTDIDWLEDKTEWKNLNAIGAVWSETERDGKLVTEHRYYLTTLTNIETFADAVRSHWGIENSLHWCLDVTFNEDKNTNRSGNIVQNLAVIRRIALNLAKNFDFFYSTQKGTLTSEKMSVRAKLKKCSYDFDFLSDLLLSCLT